jgi:uncharacterized protein (TIRG00374 family)
MNKTIKFTVGLIISGVCLWLVLKDFHLSDLQNALRDAQWQWFIAAIVVYLIDQMLRAIRWRVLLSPIRLFSPVFLFPILLVGFLLNYVLPARAGELGRSLALTKLTGIPVGSSLGTVGAERLMDFLTFFLILLLVLPFVPHANWPLEKMAAMAVIGVLGVIGGVVFLNIYRKRNHDHLPAVIQRLMAFVTHVFHGFSALKSFPKMLLIIFLSFSIWFNEALSIYFISRVFSLDFSLLQSATLLVGICIGYMIPAAPGAVGTMEFFGKQALVMMGIASATSISFLIVLHFYQILMVLIIGLPCLLHVSLAKSKLA